MRLPAIVLLAAACLLAAHAALAQPARDCVVGPGLGATLLYPYFEVGPTPGGQTTVLAIANGVDRSVLARVILWTDWAIPSLAFDLYLGPHAVQTLNVLDLFGGIVPSTGLGADLSTFTGCAALPPFHPNPWLNTLQMDILRSFHTGVPIFGLVAGENHGDGLARGYITADAVGECTGGEMMFVGSGPHNPLFYFDPSGGGAGVARADNVLWGDLFFVDLATGKAEGLTAVPLWADPARFAGRPTFYGRYLAGTGLEGIDGRVPLPVAWTQRFVEGRLPSVATWTDLAVWRDTGSWRAWPLPAGWQPLWHPLGERMEARNERGTQVQNLGYDTRFALATQRVPAASFGLTPHFGTVDVDFEGAQAWLCAAVHGSPDTLSVAFDGTPTAFLCP